MAYPIEEMVHEDGKPVRNFYGRMIVSPEYFIGEHKAAMVPVAGGMPPVCTCGFTRYRAPSGRWVELWEHLKDMNPQRSES